MMRIFVVVGALFLAQLSFAQKAEVAFRIPEKELIPEGITYDPASKSFFVSSIARRKIVKADERKKITDFVSSVQDGIGEVLGMKVRDGKLWACSNLEGLSMVHQYNITSGKLIKKWILEFSVERHLFNDLAVTSSEDVFISDSDNGAIFHISPQLDKPELWLKDDRLRDINGIALLKDGSLVVNASMGFFKINIQTKEIATLPFPGYYPMFIDGLSAYDQSMIGIQNVIFPASINRYYLNSSLDKIEKAIVLVANHPLFEIPTTGTIVDDWFYFVGNSQLQNYEKGKFKDPAKLREVVIMRVRLE
ncbi:hypothetical protein WSM22_16320 [Cytophagales bacterium WSM2-2]|nr:hypothetical protein WSM22_16320 [Cytophagales bacterium WSM2-2]